MDDKVVHLKDPAKSVDKALATAVEFARENRPSGAIVVLVTDGQIRTLFNEELRAESVVSLCEVVKSAAVDALKREAMTE